MTEERRAYLKKSLKKLIQTEGQLLSGLVYDESRVIRELGITHKDIVTELLRVVALIVEVKDRLENGDDSE